MSRARRSDFKGCDVCGSAVRKYAGLCHDCAKIARSDLSFISANGLRTCSFSGCPRLGEYTVRGEVGHWCSPHRSQLRSGSALSEVRAPIHAGSTCLYPRCDKDSMHTFPICRYHKKVAGRYGLLPERLCEILSGELSCHVCGIGLSDSEIHIDHDHSCCPQKYGCCGDCVRGVLCRGCNFALGNAKDNPQTLRALADYLESGTRL